MNSKRTIKRKSKNRKKTVRNGGQKRQYRKGGEGNITEEQKKEAEAYIQLINNYIERQTQKGVQMNLEGVKYSMFKQKFEEFKAMATKYNTNKTITQNELNQLESIVFFIIKDEVSANGMFFDEKSAGFQIWINNFIMNLLNDGPFEDEIRMKLVESFVNKKPYVKISHDKKYNNFLSEVNELFAKIKKEISGNTENNVIKETKFKVNASVEPVPE